MKANEEKPVVIYNRVATQEQNSNKLTKQEDRLIAFAKQHGYKPVAIYTDTESGRTHPFKRQGFKSLMKLAETTKPAAIIVTDYARIARKMDELLAAKVWLGMRGIKLIATYSSKGEAK